MQTINERWDEVVKRMGLEGKEAFVCMQFFYLGHQSMLAFMKEAGKSGDPKDVSESLARIAAELAAHRAFVSVGDPKDTH